MKKCVKCGADIDDNCVRCPKCGAAQESGNTAGAATGGGAPVRETPASTAKESTAAGSEQPAAGQKFCISCGKPLKPNLKFCTYCGTPVGAASPAPRTTTASATKSPAPARPAPAVSSGGAHAAAKTAGGSKNIKRTIFTISNGVLDGLTILFMIIFLLTAFLKVTVTVSILGMSDSETVTVSGFGIFGALIKGNSTLTEAGCQPIAHIASIVYWALAFLFVAVLVKAVRNIGGIDKYELRPMMILRIVITVLSLVAMILSLAAISKITEGVDTSYAKVSKYSAPIGLFVTMLIMLAGNIALFILCPHDMYREPFAIGSKLSKVFKIALSVLLSILLAVTVIVGIVGKVGRKTADGSALVSRYVQAINDRDAEKLAGCMYPEGSDEYKETVAMGNLLFSGMGTISNYQYVTVERNDYIERGKMTITQYGSPQTSDFFLQKKQSDGKWYVTQQYNPMFYDGKAQIGTGAYNPIRLTDSSGMAMSTSSGSGSIYCTYTVPKDAGGDYYIYADVSFDVRDFSAAGRTGSSATKETGGGYQVKKTLTGDRTYYLVFSGQTKYSISSKALVPDIEGTLMLNDETSVYFNSSSSSSSERSATYQFIASQDGVFAINIYNRNSSSGTSGLSLTLSDSSMATISGGAGCTSILSSFTQGETYYVTAKSTTGSSSSCYIQVSECKTTEPLKTNRTYAYDLRDLFGSSYSDVRALLLPLEASSGSIAPSITYGSGSSSDYTIQPIVLNADYETIEKESNVFTLTGEDPYYIYIPYSIVYRDIYDNNRYNLTVRVSDGSNGSTRANAIEIEPGFAATVTLSDYGSVVWYKFTAASSYSCEITTSSYSYSSVDTFLTLYGSSGSKLASNDDDSSYNNNWSKITYSVQGNSDYYIAVRAIGSGEITNPVKFSLNVKRYEDGKNYASAYKIEAGSSGLTKTYSSGSAIYFLFAPTGTRSYRISTTGTTSGYATQVFILDETGHEIAKNESISTTEKTLDFTGTAGERYYIRVQLSGSGSSSPQTTLKIQSN